MPGPGVAATEMYHQQVALGPKRGKALAKDIFHTGALARNLSNQGCYVLLPASAKLNAALAHFSKRLVTALFCARIAVN